MFNLRQEGNIVKAVAGEPIGTLIAEENSAAAKAKARR